MRILLLITAILVLFYVANDENIDDFQLPIDELQEQVTNFTEKIDIEPMITIFEELLPEEMQQEESSEETVESPELNEPAEHLFSIANIELGTPKSEVDSLYGEPQRISLNEYGTYWHSYHDNYYNFFMVTYNDQNEVAGLYTNHDLLASKSGIQLGTEQNIVLETLGESLDSLQKGFIIYQLPSEREYDIFFKDNSYITIFYDIHENNTLTAIQIIDKQLEDQRKEIYAEASTELKEGFEYQLFDLTNATRVAHCLKPLLWDELVRYTARDHSIDMAENGYFSHTNLDGESPFDRMKNDNISYHLAGENLAYGQWSAIFAHEGLMNSLGHRENILKEDYEYLGVGVAFNTNEEPFFTQNFYAE